MLVMRSDRFFVALRILGGSARVHSRLPAAQFCISSDTGLTSPARLDTFGAVETLADRVAEALRRTRPREDGPEMRQWADDVVAVAAALAEGDPMFDYGRFYSEAGGL